MSKATIQKLMCLLSAAVLVGIDQLTKWLAVTKLTAGPKVLIPGVFELTYLENRGAAFGILQNARVLFLVLTIAVLAAIVYVLFKMPADRKYGWMRMCISLIIAGAVGNMIDRAMNGYVVDFLYFSLIDFPVFNFADICVTIAAFAFIILILFYYKDEDLHFLSGKKEAVEEEN